MDDLSGRTFGAYRIVKPLGAGGMASVYKAYQPAVDRDVALKILPSHLAHDQGFFERFEQEAKVLAQLQHPHILSIYDFGESDGFAYIVMPFIKTGTLAAALTGQPLPFNDIKRVITQVGDALDCAHAHGLVHRDIKPSNILLDNRGNCLLADFGIAKILEGADTLTVTGAVMGTPKYMSPEQGMGNPIDGRSDIYSLGVVLYEMATGQAPFEAETPLAVVIKHIHDPLPIPSKLNPSIPESLQRMIFRAMHKEPSGRFTNAGALVEAMSAITLGSDQSSTASPSRELGVVPTLQTVVMPPRQRIANATEPITAATEPVSQPATQLDGVAASEAVAPALPATVFAQMSDMRRVVTIGGGALFVLILLLLFMRGTAPEIELAQPRDQFAPEVPELTDTVSSAANGGAIPSEPAVTPLTEAPPPVTSSPGDSEALTTNTTGAPNRTPAADSTREPTSFVDTPSDGELDFLRARAEAEREYREAEAARDPFPDQGNGTFLDRMLGMRWTTSSGPNQGIEGFVWTDANSYCQELSLGDSPNWRLPTRDELDSVLQRLNPARYAWGFTLWSADRPFGQANRLWVTNSPLYAPEWSTTIRDASARRLSHRAVCVSPGQN